MISLISFTNLANGQNVEGKWLAEDKNGHLEIKKRSNRHYGRITWLENPNDPETGLPKKDVLNPDISKREVPLIGLVIMDGFRYNGAKDIYDGGTLYDPNSGNTYDCYLELASEDVLKVSSYVSLPILGKTSYLTRIE